MDFDASLDRRRDQDGSQGATVDGRAHQAATHLARPGGDGLEPTQPRAQHLQPTRFGEDSCRRLDELRMPGREESAQRLQATHIEVDPVALGPGHQRRIGLEEDDLVGRLGQARGQRESGQPGTDDHDAHRPSMPGASTRPGKVGACRPRRGTRSSGSAAWSSRTAHSGRSTASTWTSPGADLRAARAQRRREDDDGRDPRGLPRAGRRRGLRARPRPGPARPRLAGPAGHRPAVNRRDRRADRPRAGAALRRLLPEAARPRRGDRDGRA